MKTALDILHKYFHHFKSERTRDIVVKAMETYANQSKWISVEDRLPEVDIPVLCLQSSGFEHKIWEQMILIYDGINFVDIDELTLEISEGYYLNITHWQYLPEKP